MKRKILNIIIVILFVCGVAVILYPSVTNWMAENESKDYIEKFNEVAQTIQQSSDENELIEGKSLDDLLSDMQAYNKDIYENGQSGLRDPFSYETPAFDLSEYGIDQDIVGYVTIPRMAIELPIYLGATSENLAKGVTNLGFTSIPIGGDNTNTVLAGHRGYKGIAMFRNIESLQIGDKIYITNFWETLVYQVVETKIILPSDMSEIYIQEGKNLVTLLTCHPYTKNYQRYIVYSEFIGTEPNGISNELESDDSLKFGNIFKINELSSSEQLIFIEHWVPIVVVLFLFLLLFIRFVSWIIHRKRA